MPILVGFVVAVAVGLAFRGAVGLRLRAAARRPDVTDDDLCSLNRASRISGTTVVISLAGLALVAAALALR